MPSRCSGRKPRRGSGGTLRCPAGTRRNRMSDCRKTGKYLCTAVAPRQRKSRSPPKRRKQSAAKINQKVNKALDLLDSKEEKKLGKAAVIKQIKKEGVVDKPKIKAAVRRVASDMKKADVDKVADAFIAKELKGSMMTPKLMANQSLHRALYGGKSFFRKWKRPGEGAHRVEGFKRELAICKMIHKAGRMDNVVEVLGFGADFIDYAMLDYQKKPPVTNKAYLAQVYNGLRNLHSIGVVHLDIKWENTVWDPVRKQWCIIDFDASGVISPSDPSKWKMKPAEFQMYYDTIDDCKAKKYGKLCSQKTRARHDDVLFADIYGVSQDFVMDLKR